MGRGTFREVRDVSGDPRKGPGQVEGPSERPGTGQKTLGKVLDGSVTHGEVRDRLEDPQGGPGRVRGHLGSSGTGRGTIR